MPSPVFILSTGRTGTQFFEDYFNQTSKAVCRHEPWPSRRFKFLSNLYLNQKVGKRRLGRIYLLSRKRLFASLRGRSYIESSNFLFGCIPALKEIYGDLRIVHLVRHPHSYVSSHLGKGFWRGHKRFFARFVPYWLEKLPLDKRNDPIEILAARWNYVNSQIASYEADYPYLRIRFEELFSEDKRLASQTLNQIREFCDLPVLEAQENESWLWSPKNVSRRKKVLKPGEKEYIQERCSDLMKLYHYSAEPA